MEKEIRIRKANKILRVSENEVAKYIAIGYDIIDNKGNVVQASVPHDPNVLRKAFIDNQATISQLKEEIAILKEEIALLKATPSEAVAVQATSTSSTRKRSKRTE